MKGQHMLWSPYRDGDGFHFPPAVDAQCPGLWSRWGKLRAWECARTWRMAACRSCVDLTIRAGRQHNGDVVHEAEYGHRLEVETKIRPYRTFHRIGGPNLTLWDTFSTSVRCRPSS
ncbi:unnamed protein product [Trichogramma brassicae]|uniref:Uncharacterized protein n=1 Tax=Trichogramma brassicae TaxID=86971 RepID=A0A6H5HXP4_9HYME|nr:unnamed protein product [Trichogramma brassicae]